MRQQEPELTRDEALRQLDAELDALRRQRKRRTDWFEDGGPADILLELARAFFARIVTALVLTIAVILLFADSCSN